MLFRFNPLLSKNNFFFHSSNYVFSFRRLGFFSSHFNNASRWSVWFRANLKKGLASPSLSTSVFGKPQFFLLKRNQLAPILPDLFLYLQKFFPRITSKLDFSIDVLFQKWYSCFADQKSFSVTKFQVRSFLLCSLLYIAGSIKKLLSTKNNKHTRSISTLPKRLLRQKLSVEYSNGLFTSIGMTAISSFIDEAFTIEWQKLVFLGNADFLSSKKEKLSREIFHFTILDLMLDPFLSDEVLTTNKHCLFRAFFRSPPIGGLIGFNSQEGKKVKIKFRKRFYIRLIISSSLISYLPRAELEFFDTKIKRFCFLSNKIVLTPGVSRQYFWFSQESGLFSILSSSSPKVFNLFFEFSLSPLAISVLNRLANSIYEHQPLKLVFKKSLLSLGYLEERLGNSNNCKALFYKSLPYLDYRGRLYIPFFSSMPAELRPLIFLTKKSLPKKDITNPQLFAILQLFYGKPMLAFSRPAFHWLKHRWGKLFDRFPSHEERHLTRVLQFLLTERVLRNSKLAITQLQALEALINYSKSKKTDLIEISLNAELDQKSSAWQIFSLLTGNIKLAKLCGLLEGYSGDLYSVVCNKLKSRFTYTNFIRWAIYKKPVQEAHKKNKPLRPFYLFKNKRFVKEDLSLIANLIDRSFSKSIMIPKIFGAGKTSLIQGPLSELMEAVTFSEVSMNGSILSKNFVYSEFLYHVFTKVIEEVTGIETWQRFLQEVHDVFFANVVNQADCGSRVFDKSPPVFNVLLPDGSVASWASFRCKKYTHKHSLFASREGLPSEVVFRVPYERELSLDKSKIAFMANISHALDASILRLILADLHKEGIDAIPLHDCVKVCVLDIPYVKIRIKILYNQIFKDSALLVSNLFLNSQNKKVLTCEGYNTLSKIVDRFLKKRIKIRKLLDKADKSVDIFQ